MTDVTVPEQSAKRRGRPPKVKQAHVDPSTRAQEKHEVAAPKRASDEITYVPDIGDNVFTEVDGIKFQANKPVTVPRTTTTLTMLRKETTLADGSVVSRSVETRIPFVEKLRDNPWFSINGAEPPKRKRAERQMPTDPDQYRGYAIRWIAGSNDAVAMQSRWEGEASMRERLGVNERDLDHISPFFEARMLELKGGARMIEAI